MKKLFALTFAAMLLGCTSAHALDWWLQGTICRLDTTRCYPTMSGAGYDAEAWDVTGNCRGMKYICGDALTGKNDSSPVLVGRQELSKGTGINSDYDINALNQGEGCFGVRRSSANGSMVANNGVMTRVFCPGVLSNPDEYLDYGEIVYDTARPTCAELAADGYIATLNGKCYGKYYDVSKYYIECGAGTDLMPTRIVVLNGADMEPVADGTPAEKSDADSLFDRMYSKSKSQKKIHFNQ